MRDLTTAMVLELNRTGDLFNFTESICERCNLLEPQQIGVEEHNDPVLMALRPTGCLQHLNTAIHYMFILFVEVKDLKTFHSIKKVEYSVPGFAFFEM